MSDQSGSRSSDRNQDRFDGSHTVPREHRTISCMKPSGGLDETSRMVTTILSRVATWISLDLDRLEVVESHTLRGNHTLARVNRWKVSGSHLGMWSPTNTSVLDGRSVRRIPSVIIVTVRVTALVISWLSSSELDHDVLPNPRTRESE
jgi:hypothetical protein